MATRSISQGFDVFHKNITPSNYESGKASSHKSSITKRLEAYYDLKQFFYSGSARSGTDISYLSDVDYFAYIPTNKLKNNSATSLREIKECLQGRYPGTQIYVDSPAVVLNFGSGIWDTAEVIPADFVMVSNKNNIYDIPNGSEGWMRSSPTTHRNYVTSQNVRLDRKLKPLIRMLKAWKYYCKVPISSFYLELRVTKLMEKEASIIYDIDLLYILKKLNSFELAAIQDPKGISGHINACPTIAKKSDALSKLSSAITRAQKATDAENAGDTITAFDWWDKVFAGNFPSYYY